MSIQRGRMLLIALVSLVVLLSGNLADANETTCKKMASTAVRGLFDKPLEPDERRARQEVNQESTMRDLGYAENSSLANRMVSTALHLSTVDGMTENMAKAELYAVCIGALK